VTERRILFAAGAVCVLFNLPASHHGIATS